VLGEVLQCLAFFAAKERYETFVATFVTNLHTQFAKQFACICVKYHGAATLLHCCEANLCEVEHIPESLSRLTVIFYNSRMFTLQRQQSRCLCLYLHLLQHGAAILCFLCTLAATAPLRHSQA